MIEKTYSGALLCSIIVLTFTSYSNFAEALEKATSHFSKMTDEGGSLISESPLRLRRIRTEYENGEYIVKLEILTGHLLNFCEGKSSECIK